jgi:hypothetical protein
MLKDATVQGTAFWHATAQEAAEALTAVADGMRNRVVQPVVGRNAVARSSRSPP